MGGDQLTLGIQPDRDRRLPERVRRMVPTMVDAPFDDPDCLFEPAWPGIRALAYVQAGTVRIEVEGLADPLDAFPELRALPAQLRADGVILDGTLLVLDRDGRPGPRLLRGRLEGGAGPGRPAYIASDLLWSDGVPWTRRSYAVRRRALEEVLPAGDRAMVASALEGEGTLLAEALAPLGIGGLSARRLTARYRPGPAGDAWMVAPIAGARPRARPRLAVIQRLPLAS